MLLLLSQIRAAGNTDSLLERVLREIRRRNRVVGAFADGQSALNLPEHACSILWDRLLDIVC